MLFGLVGFSVCACFADFSVVFWIVRAFRFSLLDSFGISRFCLFSDCPDFFGFGVFDAPVSLSKAAHMCPMLLL